MRTKFKLGFTHRGTGKSSMSASYSSKPKDKSSAGSSPSTTPAIEHNRDRFEDKKTHRYHANTKNGAFEVKTQGNVFNASAEVNRSGKPDIKVDADLRNDSATAQLEKGGWAQTTPRFTQHEPNNCGPAVVAMLAASTAVVRPEIGTGLMNEVATTSTHGELGSTPQQMGEMLAKKGIAVKEGVAHNDERLLTKLDEALKQGNKIVALVDSEAIRKKDGGTGSTPGSAHWVIIDGKNEKNGSYLVKNPATGEETYFLSRDELQKAFTAGTRESGGFLAVSALTHGVNANELKKQNAEHAHPLGNTPGGGSGGGKIIRESGHTG